MSRWATRSARDDVYAEVANAILPVGIGGIVLAAAVARNDVLPMFTGRGRATSDSVDDPHSDAHMRENRTWVLGLGILIIAIAAWMSSLEGGESIVVASLTIAYDILVGGLLVAILGGLLWRRGTGPAAAASMIVGTVVTLDTMAFLGVQKGSTLDGILANEPIHYGLATSFVVYVVMSLMTKPVPQDVRLEWERRVSGARPHLPGLEEHFRHDLEGTETADDERPARS